MSSPPENFGELRELLITLTDPDGKGLTEAQQSRLNEMVTNDDTAARFYADYMLVHAGLLLECTEAIAPVQFSDETVVTDELSTHERSTSFPIWRWFTPLAAAAILAMGLFLWWPSNTKLPDGAPAMDTPAPATLASGWHIKPVGAARFESIDDNRVRLIKGELNVQSTGNSGTSGGALTIETPAGEALATGTEFYVGFHKPTEATRKGNTMQPSSIMRVFVIAGAVTLANSHGTVEGKANDILATNGKDAPTKLAIEANSQFAFDMYHALAKDKKNAGKNMFFSPYSMSSALAMTAEGARGKTADQMGRVLGFPKQIRRVGADAQSIPWMTAKIHTGMGALNKQFNREGKAYQLAVANALWGEQTYPFRQQFLDALNKPYGAAMNPADFARNPDGERRRINEWVEQKTNNRIKELLPPGILDSLTRLVLTNAIYFKGDWAVQFKEKVTRDMPFTLADGSKQKVKMMTHPATAQREGAKRGEAPFRYAAFNAKGAPVKGFRDKTSFQLLELPYKGDELSMVVMLPQPNGLAKLEKQLSAERLNQWIGKLKKQKVIVSLPRFRMETEYALKPTLKAMGMPAAFQPGGFTGLSDAPSARELYISAVLHKAFVEVNEEGTEAAAATAVVIRRKSKGPSYPYFNANRPFIFMIRDNATGSVLFLGRMMNPTADNEK